MRRPWILVACVLALAGACATPVTPTAQRATPAPDASSVCLDSVYVLGDVNQPGRWPLIEGQTPFTLTKLVALCGDFRRTADTGNVKVVRVTPSGRESMTVDFEDIVEGRRGDFELKTNDVVFVPERK